MYTPHVPNSLKVAYRVPEPVPRTETNCEPCDYATGPHSYLVLVGSKGCTENTAQQAMPMMLSSYTIGDGSMLIDLPIFQLLNQLGISLPGITISI
ncbi:disease resistance protein RUN1 [Trifolium repens]|nr:disease resistance protein RUN1 [Trifolium repens]